MPVLPYVDNGAQLVVRTYQSSQEQLHTLHLLGPSAFNNGDLDALCAEASDLWVTYMIPLMTFKCVHTDAFARGIRGDGDALGAFIRPTPVAGNITNEGERPQEATCIKLSTGRSGAGYRGRMFVAGLPNNVVDEGIISLGYRTDVAAALKSWLDALAAATPFEPVIISYYKDKVVRAIPVVTPIKDCISVKQTPSNLSSRNPGSGS